MQIDTELNANSTIGRLSLYLDSQNKANIRCKWYHKYLLTRTMTQKLLHY